MINWQFFPKYRVLPEHLIDVLKAFETHERSVDSFHFSYKSNEVLNILSVELEKLNYRVEKSKKDSDKIQVPVLFGRNGKLEKYFEADAFNLSTKTVIEIEAGRAVANNQFLKDLFQASVMNDVDYLVISVRNIYKNNKDFEKVLSFLEALYSSERLKLPLKGVLLIGY